MATNAETQQTPLLRMLKDSELTIARQDDDVRGRTMLDRNGDEIGKVDALFIDEHQKRVRFLRVSSGGFLGLGATKFLIPVDAITQIESERVHVNQQRENLVGAPAYSPELVSRREYFQSIYAHYGYNPYWSAGYVYPPYPYYPGAPIAGRLL